MSDAKGENEPEDPRAMARPKGEKRDLDLVAAVLIFTMVLIIIGLYAMTYMFR